MKSVSVNDYIEARHEYKNDESFRKKPYCVIGGIKKADHSLQMMINGSTENAQQIYYEPFILYMAARYKRQDYESVLQYYGSNFCQMVMYHD